MVKLIKLLGIVVIIAVPAFVLRVYSSSRSLPQTVQSEGGAITGCVLDVHGHRIVNAKVYADSGAGGSFPQAITDRNGQFKFDNLDPGTYVLHSRKEDEGYPISVFNFYDEGASRDPQVTVSAHQTTPNVIIQREKAALLKGRIVDGATGKLLDQTDPHPTLWLAQALDSQRKLSPGVLKGEFQILVPSLPITVKVTASGYEDWHYRTPEDGNRDGVLLLAPETTQELEIVMTRKKRIR